MLRRLVVGIMLAVFSSSALAVDPLTLILLRMLRNPIINAAAENIYERLTAPPEPAGPIIFAPQMYGIEETELRSVIDEGFVYLSAGQREQTFEGLKRILSDPNNATMRPQIIAELRIKATAVRQAHDALRSLPRAQKRLIALEVRDEYRKLEPEERREMLAVMQSGVVPIPRDLTDMILDELGSVQR